jgi:hypothetical protein
MALTLQIGQVYTFKFTSGEEMIARIEEGGDPWITVAEPVSVAPGPQGLGLVPSMFTADVRQKIQININNVVICALTDESVKSKYLEAVTGIQVPSKKLVLG